jgi:hypothetical protein
MIFNKNPSIYYFTNWGIFVTTITYSFFFASIVKLYLCKSPTPAALENSNFHSPWILWKWGIFFYETSLTFEIIITLFFWTVLFAAVKHSSIKLFLDHITPIVILVIDYAMNRIPFNLRHMPISAALMLIYGIVNFVKTLVTGVPVYPPLNFKDVMSYVWSVLLLGLEFIGYIAMFYFTRWKLKKIG